MIRSFTVASRGSAHASSAHKGATGCEFGDLAACRMQCTKSSRPPRITPGMLHRQPQAPELSVWGAAGLALVLRRGASCCVAPQCCTLLRRVRLSRPQVASDAVQASALDCVDRKGGNRMAGASDCMRGPAPCDCSMAALWLHLVALLSSLAVEKRCISRRFATVITRLQDHANRRMDVEEGRE